LNFGRGELSTSNENKILCNDSNVKKFDYLIFMDSRGLTNIDNNYDNTMLMRIKTFFSKHDMSYLILSRPKNLTVFPTLFNFLKLNPDLNFRNLITNLGFVDCTPKKQDNIDDIICQIKQFSSKKYQIKQHESYNLNDGSSEILQSIEYSIEYIKESSKLLNNKFTKCYFLNTSIVSEDTKIERKRPKSFFRQLEETNNLVNEFVKYNKEKNKLIDIKDINLTYDGVHYTNDGHQKIFNKIVEDLDI